MSHGVIEVRVTLKGRPVKEFRYSADSRITVGRDPGSNIFLDNPGISRHHAILELADGKLYVQDLDSANGTFLNDRQVRREEIREGDKVRIGKFSLETTFREDRRGTFASDRPQGAAHEGTMVLETAQIQRVLSLAREAEKMAPAQPAVEPAMAGSLALAPQMEARQATTPMVAPSLREPEAAPARSALGWWRTQVWGIAIGFAVGVIAGSLLVRALAG